MFKKLLLVLFTISALFFAGCNNGTEEDNYKDLSVGNIVKIDGLDYKVINNSFIKSSSRSASSSPEETNTVQLSESEKNAAKNAAKIFGDNITLLRVAGTVEIPEARENDFKELENLLVPSSIPDNLKKDDFFKLYTNSVTSSDNITYYDKYEIYSDLTLNNKIGKVWSIWSNKNTGSYNVDGEEITLEQLLLKCKLDIIRSKNPYSYKVYKSDSCLLLQSKQEQERYSVLNATYYSKANKNSPQPAASIVYYPNKEEWTSKEFHLNRVYGKDGVYSSDIRINISKDTNSFVYYISWGDDRTEKEEIIFNDTGNFTKNSLDLTNKTISAPNNSLEYKKEIVSPIPISFVKNGDDIEFGEEIYKWAEKWRNYIVKTHSDIADIYTNY